MKSTGGALLGGKKKTRKRTNTTLPLHVLKMLSTILKTSDGIGLSGANENTDDSLLQYRELLGEKGHRKIRKKNCYWLFIRLNQRILCNSQNYLQAGQRSVELCNI